MNDIYLLLGANLGEPLTQLEAARHLLGVDLGEIVAMSSIYRSEAWGVVDQPDYYNQVLHISTNLDAPRTLEICQHIEETLGRVRKEKWGARLIDIDILYFNTDIIDTERLKVPHPHLQQRRFALLPLCEIAPNYKHPVLALTNHELLQNCIDTLSVTRI